MMTRAKTAATALGALLLWAAASAGIPLHLGPPPPKEARRVVTLAPSLSELLLALGAGDRLVGVTRFDEDPRTSQLPRVGGYNDPEPEAVLRIKPDLVLAVPAPRNRGPVEALARLGISIELFPLSTVADVEETERRVARLVGLPERGEELVARLESRRARARAETAGLPRVGALLVVGLEPLIVAGPASFAGELLEDLGAVNVAESRSHPFPRLSVEAAVRGRPDVIILGGVQQPAGRPLIPGLERVRVAALRSNALLHPGPRLVEGIDDLQLALRPAHAGVSTPASGPR